MKYKEAKVLIGPKGEKRLENAIKNKSKSVSLLMKLDDSSDKVFLLSKSQVRRLKLSPTKIKLSQMQINANTKHEGGFLFTLASILAATVPTLVTAVAAGAIERAVAGSGLWLKRVGNGLYLRRNGKKARVKKQGNKIHLMPTEHFPDVKGDGLFLVKDGHIYQPTEYENEMNILY